MAATVVVNIISYLICLCKLLKNGNHFFTGLNCLKLAEVFAFGSTLAWVGIYGAVLPIGWTFLRYKPSQTNYPFSSQDFTSFEQIFGIFGGIIAMTGICILVMSKFVKDICSDKDNQFMEAPQAAYMAHQTHSFQ